MLEFDLVHVSVIQITLRHIHVGLQPIQIMRWRGREVNNPIVSSLLVGLSYERDNGLCWCADVCTIMTLWHGNVFSITVLLWGESTSHGRMLRHCANVDVRELKILRVRYLIVKHHSDRVGSVAVLTELGQVQTAVREIAVDAVPEVLAPEVETALTSGGRQVTMRI